MFRVMATAHRPMQFHGFWRVWQWETYGVMESYAGAIAAKKLLRHRGYYGVKIDEVA